MGRGALHHGDVGAVLPKVGADVVRRVVGADHHGPLAAIAVAAGVPARMMALALEILHAGIGRQVRDGRHAGGEHELLRAQRHGLAVAQHLDGPFLGFGIVSGRAALRPAPIVELHDLRVHLQPVADLVLRGENGPVVGEGQVGKVVVPDRVVQMQRLVAAAPLVAGPLVLVDDQGRDAEPLQPRPERDAALAATDHQTIGLARDAEFRLLVALAVEPGTAALANAVLDALLAIGTLLLLEALELAGRGEERPGLVAFQPQVAPAARHLGLEADPGLRHAVGFGRGLVELPMARPDGRKLRLQHGPDGVAALERLDVPGESDEVAPEGVLAEEGSGGLGVSFREMVSNRSSQASTRSSAADRWSGASATAVMVILPMSLRRFVDASLSHLRAIVHRLGRPIGRPAAARADPRGTGAGPSAIRSRPG